MDLWVIQTCLFLYLQGQQEGRGYVMIREGGGGEDGLINVSGPHWAGLGLGRASPMWWVSFQAGFLSSTKACRQSLKPWMRLIPKGNYFLFCNLTILSSEEGAFVCACTHNEIIFVLLFELHQIRQVISQPPCDSWLTDNYLLPILLYELTIQKEKAIAYMQNIPFVLFSLQTPVLPLLEFQTSSSKNQTSLPSVPFK